MKQSGFLFLLLFSFVMTSCNYNKDRSEFPLIDQYTKELEDVEQLIIVTAPSYNEHRCTIQMIERDEQGKWREVMAALNGFVGRNGISPKGEKREGDGKTPTGLYSLKRLFTTDTLINSRLSEVIFSTEEDKWIDDPTSPDYNLWIRGATKANSFENMLRKDDKYKYCMVIEYNTDSIIKGAGSAIFFHISDSSTAGCVAVSEDELISLLGWLSSDNNPHIVIGVKAEEPIS